MSLLNLQIYLNFLDSTVKFNNNNGNDKEIIKYEMIFLYKKHIYENMLEKCLIKRVYVND
jgi:hypothetical protein